MTKCTKEGCDQDAKYIIKLHLFADGFESPAEVFATICACSEEHKISDGEIHLFFRSSWEILAAGFEVRGLPRPILQKTEFAWGDIEEDEEYKRLCDVADPSFKKDVQVN